jgi:outer membrane protein OmpA-like peptidoglycan-associated protein
MLSWATPAYQCEGSLTEPEPEPEPPPIAEPEPPPEPEPERVAVKEDKIEISEVVQFETDSAVLLPESEGLLAEVAKAIQDHPDIKRVQVEGHTDSRASDSYNQQLSQKRAKAVREFLIGQGVDKKRLVAKGFGESTPIADNETDEGRFKNRRVEFKILERELASN